MNFQEELEKNKNVIQKCQKEKELQSCLKCLNVLNCAMRKEYVSSVYALLNKGQKDSDFDF